MWQRVQRSRLAERRGRRRRHAHGARIVATARSVISSTGLVRAAMINHAGAGSIGAHGSPRKA